MQQVAPEVVAWCAASADAKLYHTLPCCFTNKTNKTKHKHHAVHMRSKQIKRIWTQPFTHSCTLLSSSHRCAMACAALHLWRSFLDQP